MGSGLFGLWWVTGGNTAWAIRSRPTPPCTPPAACPRGAVVTPGVIRGARARARPPRVTIPSHRDQTRGSKAYRITSPGGGPPPWKVLKEHVPVVVAGVREPGLASFGTVITPFASTTNRARIASFLSVFTIQRFNPASQSVRSTVVWNSDFG